MNSLSKRICAGAVALMLTASVGAASGFVSADDNTTSSSASDSAQTPQDKLEALLVEIDAMNKSDYNADSAETFDELKEQHKL